MHDLLKWYLLLWPIDLVEYFIIFTIFKKTSVHL